MRAEQWAWSSYQYYELDDDSIIRIDWDGSWPICWRPAILTSVFRPPLLRHGSFGRGPGRAILEVLHEPGDNRGVKLISGSHLNSRNGFDLG